MKKLVTNRFYRTLLTLSLTIILLVGLFIWAAAQEGAGEKSPAPESMPATISPAQAKEMMASLSDYILLDVRSEEEYFEKRIPGAMLIPDGELSERAEKELPDKETPILVYCRSGRRSAASAKLLSKLGYLAVYDMGGIQSWPYETVSGMNECGNLACVNYDGACRADCNSADCCENGACASSGCKIGSCSSVVCGADAETPDDSSAVASCPCE